jgi:hypothetical protein
VFVESDQRVRCQIFARTSAVTINEFLADDRMNEEAMFEWLQSPRWKSLDVPATVRREVEALV